MRDVIILRGAPGVGKTCAAKFLARHFPQGILMEVDGLRCMVISVDWKNTAQHLDALEVSATLADSFLGQGYTPVIVVDTFSKTKLPRYLERLEGLGRTYVSFALYASDQELAKRIERRPSHEFREVDVCVSLNRDTTNALCEGEHVMDTTQMAPEDVAKAILRTLESLPGNT